MFSPCTIRVRLRLFTAQHINQALVHGNQEFHVFVSRVCAFACRHVRVHFFSRRDGTTSRRTNTRSCSPPHAHNLFCTYSLVTRDRRPKISQTHACTIMQLLRRRPIWNGILHRAESKISNYNNVIFRKSNAVYSVCGVLQSHTKRSSRMYVTIIIF